MIHSVFGRAVDKCYAHWLWNHFNTSNTNIDKTVKRAIFVVPLDFRQMTTLFQTQYLFGMRIWTTVSWGFQNWGWNFPGIKIKPDICVWSWTNFARKIGKGTDILGLNTIIFFATSSITRSSILQRKCNLSIFNSTTYVVLKNDTFRFRPSRW